MREDLPFTTLKPKAPILTYLHNREVPFANQICHRENIDRGFKIHKEKLKEIKKAKVSHLLDVGDRLQPFLPYPPWH